MNTRDEQRIRYILLHNDELNKSILNKNFKDLKENKILFKAIQMDVAQIGEHVHNLPNRVKKYLGDKDVSRIVYIRNAIIHEYQEFNYEELENAIYKYIPKIIKQLNELIKKNYYLK